MSDIVLKLDHVYKKYKKGELYDSLRDLIPVLTGKIFRSNKENTLDDREFWALSDINFEVKRGEAIGIIGSNGAGKSTILKILSGIIKPTKGSVQVNGVLSALIEVGAGFHQDLTGRENIYLNGTILGMGKDEIKRKFDEIVEFSGLSEFIDTPVKRYSSGMYARLGFSVAAHVEPDILLVDEVLSVGDYVFQKKCIERMNKVIKSGASVIFISHNLKAVTDLCDKSILLDKGKILEIGETQDVVKSYLSRFDTKNRDASEKDIAISKVTMSDENGESIEFETGQKAWANVEVTAKVPVEKLAVVIAIKDDNFYEIFSSSTERLGIGTFDINAGETLKFVFELDLHLASGTYHLGIWLHRYDIQKEYDVTFPAATFFVHSEKDVRGVVNLYPKVIDHAKQI